MKAKIIIVLLCIATAGYAQNNVVNIERGTNRIDAFLSRDRNAPVDADGSPFVSEDFILAELDGFEKRYEVRYNAAQDVMQFKNEKGEVMVMNYLDQQTIKLLDGSGKVYQTVMYENGKRGMAVLLWENEAGVALYAKEQIEFYPREEPTAGGYGVPKRARFERLGDLHFMRDEEGGLLKPIPIKKKDFYVAFKEKDMKSYLKKNKLSFKEGADLKKIMSYYYGN